MPFPPVYNYTGTDKIYEKLIVKPWWWHRDIINYAIDVAFKQDNPSQQDRKSKHIYRTIKHHFPKLRKQNLGPRNHKNITWGAAHTRFAELYKIYNEDLTVNFYKELGELKDTCFQTDTPGPAYTTIKAEYKNYIRNLVRQLPTAMEPPTIGESPSPVSETHIQPTPLLCDDLDLQLFNDLALRWDSNNVNTVQPVQSAEYATFLVSDECNSRNVGYTPRQRQHFNQIQSPLTVPHIITQPYSSEVRGLDFLDQNSNPGLEPAVKKRKVQATIASLNPYVLDYNSRTLSCQQMQIPISDVERQELKLPIQNEVGNGSLFNSYLIRPRLDILSPDSEPDDFNHSCAATNTNRHIFLSPFDSHFAQGGLLKDNNTQASCKTISLDVCQNNNTPDVRFDHSQAESEIDVLVQQQNLSLALDQTRITPRNPSGEVDPVAIEFYTGSSTDYPVANGQVFENNRNNFNTSDQWASVESTSLHSNRSSGSVSEFGSYIVDDVSSRFPNLMIRANEEILDTNGRLGHRVLYLAIALGTE